MAGSGPGSTAEGFAAERWFLERGLPTVLAPGALVRRLWVRSAPALAALAVIAVNSLLVVAISGEHTVDIAGRPDLAESVVLVLLAGVLPMAAVIGWSVSRIDSTARRGVVVVVSLAAIACGALFGGPSARPGLNIALFGGATAAVLALTASGVGAVLGWVVELTVSNVASAASLFVRALPVVLLTFLVFFNTYVWLMTSLISRGRLWLGMGFLLFVAGSFLVASTLDRVRPLLRSGTGVPVPFSVPERLNIVFVVTASQLVHVLTVAALTGTVFLVLGLILVSPPVLDAWTRGSGRPDGEVLGMTLPIPDALIQTSMLLTAITFMYLAAKTVTDAQYRAQFLDPMLEDLRETLAARNRYRASRSPARMTGMDIPGIENVFGQRYGEILLVRSTDSGPTATVYNTFPLNDCPAQLWDALDAKAIAEQNDAIAALLNGPRYWLMSGIVKRAGEPQPTRTFGGIEMIEQATVQMASTNPQPYSVNRVDRRAVFTFDAGRPVFELVDADGRRWVMQTYSQVVDKTLDLSDLPGLGSRLQLPAGWRYESRTLTEPLVVDTTESPAQVLQDDLTNSYSLES